ncbi:MAG: hypothetical protein ACF8SC_13345 [Phycisphaerales bacterium JB037]
MPESAHPLERRHFLGLTPLLMLTPAAFARTPRVHRESQPADPLHAPSHFPLQDPAEVQEVVGKSHFDLDAVTELVTARPALARAAIDWGFGDWESALGAASHTGRREIAELLIAHGARPNLFTHAMLGDIDIVRATLTARPQLAAIKGPHGITLLDHARAGGHHAEIVLDYLSTIPEANQPDPARDLPEDLTPRYLGSYSFGTLPDERLIVSEKRGTLHLEREGQPSRRLLWQGGDAFTPAGAPSVRITFAGDRIEASTLTVHDPMPIVTATRTGMPGRR